MMKRAASFAKPLGAAIDELVGKLGLKPKLQEYEAVLQWEEVVGPQIASVSAAVRITKGTLFVKVKTATWRNELTLLKPEVIRKLNDRLGGEVVKDIRFL